MSKTNSALTQFLECPHAALSIRTFEKCYCKAWFRNWCAWRVIEAHERIKNVAVKDNWQTITWGE